jgi:hypothetical protein
MPRIETRCYFRGYRGVYRNGAVRSGSVPRSLRFASYASSFKMYSSTSSLRALENPLSSPQTSNPHLSNTRMEATLSLATRA